MTKYCHVNYIDSLKCKRTILNSLFNNAKLLPEAFWHGREVYKILSIGKFGPGSQ